MDYVEILQDSKDRSSVRQQVAECIGKLPPDVRREQETLDALGKILLCERTDEALRRSTIKAVKQMGKYAFDIDGLHTISIAGNLWLKERVLKTLQPTGKARVKHGRGAECYLDKLTTEDAQYFKDDFLGVLEKEWSSAPYFSTQIVVVQFLINKLSDDPQVQRDGTPDPTS